MPATYTNEADSMKTTNLFAVTSCAMIAVLASSAAVAASKAKIDMRVERALHHFNRINPAHESLEANAAGELVFPRITKGGIGVAGEYGEGALRVHGQTVGYYSVSAASVGLTVGLAKHSEVILFNTQEALDKFTNSKGWAVGADVGIAVASKGAGADYDTVTMKKPVVAFVFGEKGLIADASVDGTKVNKIER
jgi:lipid-binding SYLF domain-containing protein